MTLVNTSNAGLGRHKAKRPSLIVILLLAFVAALAARIIAPYLIPSVAQQMAAQTARMHCALEHRDSETYTDAARRFNALLARAGSGSAVSLFPPIPTNESLTVNSGC